ncbi:MAG: histidine kinase dimerization/phospho-acceptor domain-containing protein [Nitrospirota bacterium]
MELLALLSNRDEPIISEVKKALNKYTVYPLRTIEEIEDLHANIPLNLILIDVVSHKLSAVDNLLNKLDDDLVVLIVPEKLDKRDLENLPKSIYDCVAEQLIDAELPVLVGRALENQRLKNELTLLRKTRDASAALQPSVCNVSDAEGFTGSSALLSGRNLHEKILANFAKMLSVSFDMRKLFNHFMDSVAEIARVGKMSVMLRDKEGFYIKTHYGLDPYLADSLRLKKDSALAAWLAKNGRIMHKPVNPANSAAINIKSEMELFQCIFSFPMMHKGKLIGIFNIGNKITEESFYKEELEIIYMFCNYLAAAVKDIDLYNQILYQKEFTENILSSMNSGMIAIDKEEKITVFNQQASETLGLDPSEVLGRDLRRLPSPLGDILYETMVFENSYKRHEVIIQPAKMPIRINSFRLVDENQKPIGAGIVFSDISASKKLEEQERRTEKLEAVNDLMAKIAHEVRTPLTSIHTYTQIMRERHSEDKELRDFFATTVIQSIQNLDNLIDKLVIFSSKPDYNFDKQDVNAILNQAKEYISKNINRNYKILIEPMNEPFFISADKKFLIKALYYIILSIIDRTPEGTVITVGAAKIMWGLPSAEIVIRYEGNELTEGEKQDLLKPLLDISNLGTELNVPTSLKIIESHKGSLEIKSGNGNNIFAVRLPGIEKRSSAASVAGL